MRPDFLKQNGNGTLDQLSVATPEVASVVTRCQAFLQEYQTNELTQIVKVYFQLVTAKTANIIPECRERVVLQVAEGSLHDLQTV